MRLLALDTSTEYLSLALACDGKTFLRHIHAGQTHSQQILPRIRELLDEAGASMNGLQGIAFGAGPGSFTGLRIGCGVAQGLAFGAGLPVVGIGTLLALAQASGHSRVVACLDARMGEVYHAVYIKDAAGWQEVLPPSVCRPEAVPGIEGTDWVGVGNGWAVYAEELGYQYAGQISRTMPEQFPEARAMLVLAEPMFQAGLGRPAADAAPVYIRNRVALKTLEREAGLKLN
ncbi:tRNA threonylcarbamoyladenosine biosynthesis protein TsaB [Methylophilaceae bacterium]|nr:tRNA threonylcarbamoyladenosine biosynthesis protein TsaB [Methylophilaceae bacterium]